MQGLGKQFKRVPVGPSFFQKVIGACLPGEKKDAGKRTDLANRNRRLHSVELWHDHVTKNKIRAHVPRHVDRCMAIIDGACLIAVIAQYLGQAVGDHHLIINDQYFLAVPSHAGGINLAALSYKRAGLVLLIKKRGENMGATEIFEDHILGDPFCRLFRRRFRKIDAHDGTRRFAVFAAKPYVSSFFFQQVPGDPEAQAGSNILLGSKKGGK